MAGDDVSAKTSTTLTRRRDATSTSTVTSTSTSVMTAENAIFVTPAAREASVAETASSEASERNTRNREVDFQLRLNRLIRLAKRQLLR